MNTVAARLKLALDRHPDLSQAGLARACSVSTASVSNWFTGTIKTLRADNYRKAARYLRCNRDWLETGSGDPGWDSTPPASAGVAREPVAQYASQSIAHTPWNLAAQVPVIGTLGQGEDQVLILECSGGGPIGHVAASAGGPSCYAVRVSGDALYPVVRHGCCLIVDAAAELCPGELALIEFADGTFQVHELVAMREDAAIVATVTGDGRQTIPVQQVRAAHAIVDIVSSSRFERIKP